MWKQFLGTLRTYTTASATSTAAAPAAVRDTLKKLTSRKTYLVDTYTHYLRTSPVVLVLHNSTLLKNEDKAFRRDVQKAGAQFTVVRSNLFKVALRGLEHEDPASKAAHNSFKRFKHPLAQYLNGPSAIITMPTLDPQVVDKVVSLIDKTNNRVVLLGGQVDGSVINRPDIELFRKMPTMEELRAQLAGVLTILGGAGLVNTLESSSKMLYLTLDQHRQELEKPEEAEMPEN